MSARKKSNSGRVPLGSLAAETAEYAAPVFDANVTDDLLDMMQSVAISDPNDPDVENEPIDWDKERDHMNHYFDHQAKEHLKRLPRYSKPKGFKTNVNLFGHQKDGVRRTLAGLSRAQPTPQPLLPRAEIEGRFEDISRPVYHRVQARATLPSGQGCGSCGR
jgi:hypothetical protein